VVSGLNYGTFQYISHFIGGPRGGGVRGGGGRRYSREVSFDYLFIFLRWSWRRPWCRRSR
jgi:hypothetical protein